MYCMHAITCTSCTHQHFTVVLLFLPTGNLRIELHHVHMYIFSTVHLLSLHVWQCMLRLVGLYGGIPNIVYTAGQSIKLRVCVCACVCVYTQHASGYWWTWSTRSIAFQIEVLLCLRVISDCIRARPTLSIACFVADINPYQLKYLNCWCKALHTAS